MSADQTINDVARVGLEIHRGADVVFDVEWWADKDETDPVDLDTAYGQVRSENTEAGELLVDLGAYTTVLDNKAMVRVPADITADLEPNDRAVWDFFLVSVAGETKKVSRGTARIHRSATQ